MKKTHSSPNILYLDILIQDGYSEIMLSKIREFPQFLMVTFHTKTKNGITWDAIIVRSERNSDIKWNWQMNSLKKYQLILTLNINFILLNCPYYIKKIKNHNDNIYNPF